MKKCRLAALLLPLSALHFASQASPLPPTPNPTDPLVSHIDVTVDPHSNFFLHANGRWFKENPIPANERSNGLWQSIRDTIQGQIRSICQSAASQADSPRGSNQQKIGDFYASGMDSARRNRVGLMDVKSEFDRIEGIADRKDLAKAVAHIQSIVGSPFFHLTVGQDDQLSSQYAVFLDQGGLSLPGRSFYFDTDRRTTLIRGKFIEHLRNMFRILGYGDKRARGAAARLVALETALARASRQSEDTRDALKNYNKLSLQQLRELAPHFDWNAFFATAGLRGVTTVIVGQPEFLSALDGHLATFSLRDWKDYLAWHLLCGIAPFLDDRTYLEWFHFFSTALSGTTEPKPTWKRVVEQTNDSLGQLVGQVYVDAYLPKGTKAKLLEIGNAIKTAFGERLKALDWLSATTKERALRKLARLTMKVGYPDRWRDLGSLEIDRSSYVRNVMRASTWEFGTRMAKLGQPVDRTEWELEPQTYSAYYNPSNNEVVVPGCNILVPGYEHELADDAVLYAIIGAATFGHEITHGFDDQGSRYDELGNLSDWWTPQDRAGFLARTKRIVEQFDAYVAVDSLHINGDLTQGENIADLGGLTTGYDAFKRTPQYLHRETVGGLTPERRFFLGYALAWMTHERPESIASHLHANEHSPAQFRVNGPLSNLPDFYAAFGIQPGDPMWRPAGSRVRIW